MLYERIGEFNCADVSELLLHELKKLLCGVVFLLDSLLLLICGEVESLGGHVLKVLAVVISEHFKRKFVNVIGEV